MEIMKQVLRFAAVVLLGLSPLTAGQTRAQNPGSPSRQPGVSPWQSLIQPGTNPTLNYYNQVRPQFEFRGDIQQLQQQSGIQQAELAGVAGQLGAPVPTTGHRIKFFSHQQYYGALTTKKYFQNTFGGVSTAKLRFGGGSR
jgi:hypothetical protein